MHASKCREPPELWASRQSIVNSQQRPRPRRPLPSCPGTTLTRRAASWSFDCSSGNRSSCCADVGVGAAGRELSMHWHKCLPAHRSSSPHPTQRSSTLLELPPPPRAAACEHGNMKKILIFFTAYWIFAAITFACCWQCTGAQWGKGAVCCADWDGKKVSRNR